MILSYTDDEIESRKEKVGSVRSIEDRLKFEKEFDVQALELNSEDYAIYERNPHLRQVFALKRPFIRQNMHANENLRFIAHETPTSKYQRRTGEAKTVEHWGQRKLMLSEIEFLTNFIEVGQCYKVLYVGAAPGRHLKSLIHLFPAVSQWILYDPLPFEIFPLLEGVSIENRQFTDEEAKRHINEDNLLFISDLRSVGEDLSSEAVEEGVVKDMESQKKWHLIMKPEASLLKFRLPYTPGRTLYLDGKLYFQLWAGRTSSETRLVATGNKLVEYDHMKYSDKLYHFNTVTRTSYYEHDLDTTKIGYDHCYDCSFEIYILTNYLKKFGKYQSHSDICKLSLQISQACSSTGRTLRIVPKGIKKRKREDPEDSRPKLVEETQLGNTPATPPLE